MLNHILTTPSGNAPPYAAGIAMSGISGSAAYRT